MITEYQSAELRRSITELVENALDLGYFGGSDEEKARYQSSYQKTMDMIDSLTEKANVQNGR